MAVEGYINTIGRNHLGIGICDRCKRKFPIDDLYSDRNIPSLKVCLDDVDDLTRGANPRGGQPEDITLRFPRPDVALDG